MSDKQGIVTAVAGVSFKVGSSETVALFGESGCGKSTIAMMLLGLVRPDGGRVLLQRIEAGSDKRNRHKHLGRDLSIVFQNPYSSLNPKMRIRSVVAELLKTAFRLRGNPLNAQVEKLLRDVGLGPEHLNRSIHTNSRADNARESPSRAPLR